MVNADQIKEFEDGFAESTLAISKRRREAQTKLIEAYPRLVFNQVEAHGYLNDTNKTANDLTLPNNFKDFVSSLVLEYGYNIRFNGLGFSGYAMGPMMIGGSRGQAIAKERGSLLAEGVLANDTDEGARLYASHLCSYMEYNLGQFTVKITNPGSGNPICETDPPEMLEKLQQAQDPNAPV